MAAHKKLTVAEPDTLTGVTLMRLRSEHVKRLSVVDVTLGDGVTVVGGDNGAGKSSFLDSLKFLLAGKAEIDAQPIHNGQQVATITGEFGDGQQVKLRVIRTLMKVGDTEFTTEIDVEVPGFIAPSKVQDFLSKLATGFSFDPMAFNELDDKEQFSTLRKFVSGFDFEKNAKDRKAAFDARTEVNRDHKREQAAADSIVVSAIAPAEQMDESALIAELRAAGEHNANIEARRNNRQNAISEIERLRAEAASAIAGLAPNIAKASANSQQRVTEWQDQIAALEAKIKGEKDRVATEIKLITDEHNSEAQAATDKAKALEDKLAAAGDLPTPISVDEIEAKLAKARDANRVYTDWEAQRKRRAEHQEAADDYSKQSDELTAAVADLDEQKASAIRKAHLPIDGLGFGDGFITLNNVPWSQASMAERIDASTAIAMALNPRIKVILIRDGSNLGSKIKERIAQRASAQGYRVLMEIVDESGANSHVFIENGEIGKRHMTAEEAA